MSRSTTRSALRNFLHGLSAPMLAIGALSFLFGGPAIHIFGGVDRLFAEILGIGFAFVCLIIGAVAKYKIDDLEWEQENEEGEKQQRSLEEEMNEPRS